MTEDEFLKIKRNGFRGFLGGSILFIMIAIIMFITFMGRDLGFISWIVSIPIPMGCIFLAILIPHTIRQINTALMGPPLDSPEMFLGNLKSLGEELNERMKEIQEEQKRKKNDPDN